MMVLRDKGKDQWAARAGLPPKAQNRGNCWPFITGGRNLAGSSLVFC
jgi:hypothetical protein